MGGALSAQRLQALLAREGQAGLLANILGRTERMLDAARSGDWPLVTAMENKRSQLVKQCFSETVSPENSEIFSEALAIMLHMNEELVALLNNAKADAAIQRGSDLKKHQAVAHYLDID